jgi:hypothetical protein
MRRWVGGVRWMERGVEGVDGARRRDHGELAEAGLAGGALGEDWKGKEREVRRREGG